MRIRKRDKLVVLGMMARMPVAGAVWQALHYLIGFERLGYEAHYVEAHGCISWAFGDNESEAAGYIAGVMRRFDMSDRWAFHARSGSGAYYGKSQQQLAGLYDSAAAIINLHGGTVPTAELSASNRLVYVDTDPVAVQIELHNGWQSTSDFLAQHCALFTFAENYSADDCSLPVSKGFAFRPTRQPVVLDFWNSRRTRGDKFTTIGNWLQPRRVVEYQGVEYHWSKHLEFLKFLDLPKHSSEKFELSLSSCDEDAQKLLLENGWQVRDAFSFSQDLDAYREYIARSKGEFTVAKEQNIRFRTGWFSDRSATYLAAGKPVITQETGFSNVLPSGLGLFGFSTLDDVLSALETINSDYDKHEEAATTLSRDYFSHDVVLTKLLSDLGIEAATLPAKTHPPLPTVNVIGYSKNGTGIGALVQRYVRALFAIGWPTTIIDVLNCDELSSVGRPGDINLICCDIDSYFSLRGRFDGEFFRTRYNVGIWSWELPTFPAKWHDRFAYFDEIWAPTSFIASAIGPVSPIPVVTMPPTLTTEHAGNREAGRRRLALSGDEYAYAFIFNFHSRAQRKNPLAVIDAFNAAFTPAESARLIIKSVNADFDRDCFSEMLRRAKGRRISLHDGQWNESEISDLLAASDCYVSLHRAEGVGLTISDAMAAGKPVIATGWSGNMDFMNVSNSFPVRYRLVELEEDVTHYRKGEQWAEPCVAHAAELQRYVFDRRVESTERGEAARQDILANHSTQVAGSVLANRLRLIANRHQLEVLRQTLNRPLPEVESCLDEFSALGDYVPAHYIRYSRLKNELQRIVSTRVPPDAILLVVSKGDDELLRLYDCQARHFPSDANRAYLGHHPKDSAEAIGHLDSLRAEGGTFILFPSPSFWWLEHYSEFHQHLQTRYSMVHSDQACHIFDLSGDKQGCP